MKCHAMAEMCPREEHNHVLAGLADCHHLRCCDFEVEAVDSGVVVQERLEELAGVLARVRIGMVPEEVDPPKQVPENLEHEHWTEMESQVLGHRRDVICGDSMNHHHQMRCSVSSPVLVVPLLELENKQHLWYVGHRVFEVWVEQVLRILGREYFGEHIGVYVEALVRILHPHTERIVVEDGVEVEVAVVEEQVCTEVGDD